MILSKTAAAIASAIAIFSTLSVSAATSDSIEYKAPEDHLISFDAEARLDWQRVANEEELVRSQTGFIGKYIALKAHGTITDGLTYTWRQRFSRTPKDHTFWDQTDILALNYNMGKLDLGVGKQVVLIGGYEYDRAPINLMCPNLFVTNVACYQFGVSAGYQVSSHDYLAFQVSQSLYATAADRNLYAYNLMWRSNRGLTDWLRFETIWSVNEVEFEKGKFSNFIALGNKFVINDKVSLVADLMTRTYPRNNWFKNNTFMGEMAWDISPKWRLTGKISYDCNRGVNKTQNTEIARGSQLAMGGAVVEWFPIRSNRHLLRMHAAAFCSAGSNYYDADMMQKNTLYVSLGVTWHMNLLNIR